MPGSCWTVIPSTPGAPLLRTTARNAVSMLSESQDRLHEVLCGCRVFEFGHRRDCFDLLPIQALGFTSAGHRQVQLKLVWRSRCRHETSDLLTLSFNPSSGTVRAFGQRAGLL